MNGENITITGLGEMKSVKETPMPKVGDVITLQFNPFGGVNVIKEGTAIYGGQDYYEMEVKAIKKAVVSFE